jgi:hypothetical protein
VVFLVNFLAPNLVAVCREVAQRCARFTVLSSVEMESNRNWEANWQDLEVIVQKTWTITRNVRHPGGYQEVNYVHIPTDTIQQLGRLRPDVIVSLELGARTAMSSIYRKLHRTCAQVVAVYASERSEAGRGGLRKRLRRRLLGRADWITFNGPSCQRLLQSLGADPDRMSPWDYAADPAKPYHGELLRKDDHDGIELLTVGQLSERKGMLPATQQLCDWARNHPGVRVRWHVLGSGPLEQAMRAEPRPSNLDLVLHGHCDSQTIAEHYRDSDLMLFPTLGDEWGLVVDEALFSGLPVIGSCHSQAATTLIRSGVNGQIYDPEQPQSLSAALDRYLRLTAAERWQMALAARQSVACRTPQASAEQLLRAIASAKARRHAAAVVPRKAPVASAFSRSIASGDVSTSIPAEVD